MFRRNISDLLEKWKKADDRKPLVIRGARQTGKTAAVDMFGKSFPNYVYLNLERTPDRRLFEKADDLKDAMLAIELSKKKSLSQRDTLLFIDEITSVRQLAE